MHYMCKTYCDYIIIGGIHLIKILKLFKMGDVFYAFQKYKNDLYMNFKRRTNFNFAYYIILKSIYMKRNKICINYCKSHI